MSRQRDAHESYAVAAGTLHWAAAILVGSLLVVVLGMHELSQRWLHLQPTAPVTMMPPQPRLQPDPAGDLAAERAQQQPQLDRYEWIDRDTGVARIPIERAMKVLAKHPAIAPSGAERSQGQKQNLPLAPALTPGRSAGGEGAKARGAVGYRAVPESPFPRALLGGEGWVRGKLLFLLVDRRQGQPSKQGLPLTPALSPGKSAWGEGAKRYAASIWIALATSARASR